MQDVICSNCGADASDGAYCAECGSPLRAVRPPEPS